MSCRIDRHVVGEDLVILCISGRITTQDVDMLRGLLEQETSAVAIDLKNVLLADREAVKLLAVCESNGAELRNRSPVNGSRERGRQECFGENVETNCERSELVK